MRIEVSISRTKPVMTLPATCCGTPLGFTLLEVVLAVVIATGMLGVVFYFYHQAAELRAQVLRESARTTAARLILERLTSELRTALPGTDLHTGLWGASNQLEFVRLDAPVTSTPTTGNTNNLSRPLPSTLKKIQYRLNSSPDETNNATLVRLEEPVASPPETSATNELSVVTELEAVPKGLMLTKDFQYVSFRFWNGSAWQDSWSADSLPLGIEVKLGVEPLPAETVPEEYTGELYSRIISLPLAIPTAPARGSSPPADSPAIPESEGFIPWEIGSRAGLLVPSAPPALAGAVRLDVTCCSKFPVFRRFTCDRPVDPRQCRGPDQGKETA